MSGKWVRNNAQEPVVLMHLSLKQKFLIQNLWGSLRRQFLIFPSLIECVDVWQWRLGGAIGNRLLLINFTW